jgi:hypothetical protein
MGVAGFGDGTLPASLTTGMLRGDEPQELHELSRVIEAGQVAQFRHHDDRYDELYAAQGLEGVHDRT